MRRCRAILFDDRDRVPIPHGLLIHTIGTALLKARGVPAQLKDLGCRDAIKVVESVDWDAREK